MTLVWFGLAAFACEVAGTIGGFGSSAFFVPVAQFFLPFKAVLAVTAIYHVASNFAKILLFLRHIDWNLTVTIGIPSVTFVVAGAFLVRTVEAHFATLALGIFLIGFGILFLVFPSLKVTATKANAITLGSVAGLLAGFLGTGGAIRGAALAAFGLGKNVFVGTSAAIDMGVDTTRATIYLAGGFLPADAHLYIPIVLVVAFLGSWVGKLLLARLPQDKFRTLVLGLLILIGFAMILRGAGTTFSA